MTSRSRQAISTDIELPPPGEAIDARVVGLTILYCADLARVGERAFLTGLGSTAASSPTSSPPAAPRFPLSRAEPRFAAPGARDQRPLDDARISRAPLWLSAGDRAERAVVLDCQESRTAVVANGQPVTGAIAFSRDELDAGVVLLLGGRVVLLLHLVDPASDAGEPSSGSLGDILGHSAGIVRVRRELRRVADLDVPVLILGESGSGKELVARALHDASRRRDKPYLAVNLGAVPQTLATSEMFGAVRGAFTGAHQDRPGYFQRAAGGTLFLDEIGEAAPELQVLLLRCLESGEIQPVGADRPRPVDVRVISATDADLRSQIESGRFKAPLYYRLGGYVIRVPPLRQRRDDLGRLLVAFLRRELEAIGEAAVLSREGEPWLPAHVVARLALYTWPGNVRQLANAVRQLVIGNRGARVATSFQVLDELGPPAAVARPASAKEAAVPSSAEAAAPTPAPGVERDDEPERAAREARSVRPADISDDRLVAALRAHRHSPERAAAALGIPRASIYRLIDRSSRVRKASELTAAEIEAARAAAQGDEEAMAERLEVSVRALRRRMGELSLRS